MFLGLDLSLTGTGLSLLENNYTIIKQEALSTHVYGAERLYHLELKFLSFIEEFKNSILFACMEGGAYRETGRIYQLGQWAGIVQLNLFKLGIPFIEVAPLQLKKYIQGTGKNKGKETIILDIYKNYGIEIRNDNIADAFILSRIASDFYNIFLIKESKKLDLKSYQIDVLNKLYKEKFSNRNLL